MGSNTTWKKITTGAKLALIGMVLIKEGETLNIVDSATVNASSVHEALQASSTEFTMIDEGEMISIRNKFGLEMLSLPATEENKEFYADKMITHDEYVMRGGKYSNIRRAVVNGDTYFMETFDEKTGARISLDEIGSLEDEITNNKNLTLEDLVDFVKLISGEEFLQTPDSIKEKLSYYDMSRNEVVTGTPFTVLSSALKNAGFNEDQINKIFEGTDYEDADRKEQRREQLEETEFELSSSQFREVKYYDAVKVNGELDIKNMKEMSPAEISQTIIDRYASIVKGYEDADERIGEFTSMMSDYTSDTSDADNKKKLAMVIGLFDACEDGTIKKERQKFDRKVNLMFKQNRTNFEKQKGSKFDQFDEFMEEKLLVQMDAVEEAQNKFDRLANAHAEAMAYADECITNGKIEPGYYEYVVEKKEKEIADACMGVTEESLEESWDELDRIDREMKKMQDFKILDFVIGECESKLNKEKEDEVALINGQFYYVDTESLDEKYNLVREAEEFITGEEVSDSPKMVAASIEDFYGGNPYEVETSDALDEIVSNSEYVASDLELDETNAEIVDLDDLDI